MFASPSENTAYILALRYLKYRSRSIKEIQDYLKKKQVPEGVIAKIVKTLLEQKFLDDQSFARMWVRNRILLNPLSQRVLRMELSQKGINKEIIDTVLSEKKRRIRQ